jgi:hypothetical protein
MAMTHLALLVGYIPRLNYSPRLRQLIIAVDPGALDHGAAGGHGLLLILGREGLRTELSAQRLQNLPWFALWVEHVAGATEMNSSIPSWNLFVLFRNRRQAQDGPLIGTAPAPRAATSLPPRREV